MQHLPDDSDVFDLSQIFIGREQQIDLFQIYLNRWKQLIFNTESNDTPITASPSPYNKIQGLVVLLYGRGGFGKSTLLRRYRDFILKENQYPLSNQAIVSKVIDWEFAVEGKRNVFNPSEGQELAATEVFNVLRDQLADALDKDSKQFKEYQTAAKAVNLAEKEGRGVLERLQSEKQYDWLRGLAVEGIRTVVQTYVPGSKPILDNTIVKKGMDEAAKLTQEQISRVHAKLNDKLGTRLGDYLAPTLRLGLALGRDLAEFAKNFPLLVFFDTYEEIDEGDKLLRIVMGAAGLRVGWIIAGRGNLWAGLEQAKRNLDMEYGYKEIVFPNRGLPVDFNVGGVGAFTPSDIKEFFDMLCKEVHFKPALPSVTEDEAKRILDVTLGIPLAVKIAAGLYRETANLDTIIVEVEGKREIVDQMVQRYLLHTRIDRSERANLYGLALLRKADRPGSVVAALGLSPEEAKTSYTATLSQLQRRYSFIFTEKDGPSLHQEVRHFLRLWLLERSQEPDILAVNEQLKAAHETVLQRLEEHRQYSSLKERLQDDEWVQTYLDLTQQQYWIDTFEGVRYALPFMLAAIIYNKAINWDIAKTGNFFQAYMRSPCKEWWKCATKSLVFALFNNSILDLESLAELLKHHRLTFPSPFQIYYTELEAILWWQLGNAYRYRDCNIALEWYEKALTQLEYEYSLKEDAAKSYVTRYLELYDESKWNECMPLLNRAITLKPNYILAYRSRGLIYEILKNYEQTLKDYNYAIELDPNDAESYGSRGFTYSVLKEYERALEDCNRAIALNPTSSNAYIMRGAVHIFMKEYQLGFQDISHSAALNPKPGPAVYYNRGLAYLYIRDKEHAKADLQRRSVMKPTNVNAVWLVEWINMDKQIASIEVAERLEEIAATIPEHYVSFLCRGIALGLRNMLKQGLIEIEKAISLVAVTVSSVQIDPWEPYFWQGLFCAYYYKGRYQKAIESIEKSLELNLPPVLLTPLYWLEKERPDFFDQYARNLLEKYDI